MTDILSSEEFIPARTQKRTRIFAASIDYIIIICFFIFMAYSYGERYTPEGGGVGVRLNGSQTLVCFAFWFAFLPLVEAFTGQSIGKMLLGIRVVSADYSRPTFGQIIVRRIFDFVDWLPFFGIVGIIVASNNKEQQRVGDLVAKTIVVKK